jgi:D-serine deaminase-like pyridoxal phosphate-dependent protein
MTGTPIHRLDTPRLLVDLDVLERNISRMVEATARHGIGWRPHTKGIKLPAIAHKLIRAGAIGVTCAKLGEAEVMAAAGIGSILIANQIVGEEKIARLIGLSRHAEVIACVDDSVNVTAIGGAAAAAGVEQGVLVEVDTGMQRCGVAPGAETVALARRVAETPGLRLRGLMGWEGHVAGMPPGEQKRAATEAAVGLLTSSAAACRVAGLPIDIVSCGGTGTHPITAGLPGVTEIQAGGAIFHDLTYAAWGLDHEFALTVLVTVISRPTPTRVVVDAGKKTLSSDLTPPRARAFPDATPLRLSAEHGQFDLAAPSPAPAVGERIELLMGYGDTSVHLHETLVGVRNGHVEIVWPLLGRGKLS